MDIYCLDQLTVYWNARRILNIDWEKSGEQKEKRNLKHNEKFEWKNLKYYTIKQNTIEITIFMIQFARNSLSYLIHIKDHIRSARSKLEKLYNPLSCSKLKHLGRDLDVALIDSNKEWSIIC